MSTRCYFCRAPLEPLEGPYCESCRTAIHKQTKADANHLRKAGTSQFMPTNQTEEELHRQRRKHVQFGTAPKQ